jgi:addiction module HigA family antidote
MAHKRDFHTPVHPGEILYEEFMVPYGLSANKLAGTIGVPANRITALVNGTRAVTADTAIRLGEAFGTTPEFWMNLQNHFELKVAVGKERPAIARIETPAERQGAHA